MRRRLEAFVEDPAQRAWLDDWTLYASLKARFRGVAWTDWDAALARREPASIDAARAELGEEIAYHRFEQFLFFEQWDRLRAEAASRGIRILGDVPIYVAQDSADVWSNRELFQLDENGLPTVVAGVPPDYFSATGQLWGNPLYRWDVMERDGYAWWVSRIAAALSVCDLLRIDHFRAFSAYWSVPATDETALNGRWVPGPGRKLFDAARRALGGQPLALLAEDLGDISKDVRELLAALRIPGMKVLQFAFYGADGEYLPHRYKRDCVVYTGTHDNDTARGWYEGLTPEERQRVGDYLGSDGREIEWGLIRAAWTSVADRAIVPIQDVLGLGREARMNDPSRPEGNWHWRLAPDALRPDLAERLRRLTELSGRVSTKP